MLRVAVLAAVLVSLAVPALAETGDDVSRQFWLDLILSHPRSDKLTFQLNLRTRHEVSGDDPFRAYRATPLVGYYPGSWIDLIGDVIFEYTNQVEALNSFQITPRAGVRLHVLSSFREKRGFERIPTSKMYIGTLLRLEWRNFNYSGERPSEHETRFRGRIETRIALNHDRLSQPGTLYIIFDGEAFVTLSESQVSERFASKFRVRLGPGYRFGYKFRLELLYIGDDDRNTLEDGFNVNTRMLDLRLRYQF